MKRPPRNAQKPLRYQQPDTPPESNNNASTTTEAAASSSSTAAINNATTTTEAPPSEAPTIVPTPNDDDDDNNVDDDARVAVAFAEDSTTDDASNNNNTSSSLPSRQRLPLHERIPSTVAVLEDVRIDYHIRQHFANSKFFKKKEDQDVFFDDTDLWDGASDKMVYAITKYTPQQEKDIKRKSEKFEAKKDKIVDSFISHHELEGVDDDISLSKHREMTLLLHIIGSKFIELFQKLITPPGGKKRVPINEQIEAVVLEVKDTSVGELFEDKTVAQHVYYIIGFLCNAGAKEAARRSGDSATGECIKSLDRHFALGREDAKLIDIKTELPDGVTDLVDRRCSMGGLKYPNLQLYTVFAVIEKVYSSLATPVNFTLFGGMLLVYILDGMLKNEVLTSLFAELFHGTSFTEDTIETTMKYYLKVFGNVRAKDLCYRMNSNITKAGATVGVRQTLAAMKGGTGGTKTKTKQQGRKKKRKKNQPTTEENKKKKKEEEDETVEEEVEKQQPNTSQQSAAAMDIDDDAMDVDDAVDDDTEDDTTYASSDDELSVYVEEQLTVEGQHEVLKELAEQDMEDNEDYAKDCTELSEDEEDEFMGKTLVLNEDD